MSVDVLKLFETVRSHVMASGYVEEARMHEPDNAPGDGISAALWLDSIRPVPPHSGLAATSALFLFNLRFYESGMTEPKDEIDPEVAQAVFAVMGAFTGDFTLDGSVAYVDLLGHVSQGLKSESGYVNSSELIFRVMTVDIPIVINDAWVQAE
ncbi:MAG: hypothetical protein ACREQA_19770 [Candidatus Binatia bacterium]